eukprot:1056421-Karenia_brevis.AAC.2
MESSLQEAPLLLIPVLHIDSTIPMDRQVVVPLYAAAPCAHCGALTLPSSCQRCGYNFCAACGSDHCYYCWEWRRSDTQADMTGRSIIDFELTPLEADFEDSPRSNENQQTLDLVVATGSDHTGSVDLYDKLIWAWNEGGPVQLKFNISVQVAHVSDVPPLSAGACQRQLDASIATFQRLAEHLAWDVPKGIVAVHLDRKKTVVFQPGQKANSATLESGLSWIKHDDSFGVVIRACAGATEFGILDVTWCAGQTSRLPFFQNAFLSAASAMRN